MRVIVFSDMHGNCVALDAVLDEVRGDAADAMVCLGDAIQGGPQPAQVVARLRELGCPVVMGNADAWLLTGEETGAEPIEAERLRKMEDVRSWSLSQLSDADRAFIAAFKPTVETQLGNGVSLLGFHGSPHSFDDIILPTTPESEIQHMLGGFEPHFLAGGHTHVQQLRHLDRSFYFGCGSVGLAYRHNQPSGTFRADPWAEYAVLTSDRGRVSLDLRRVPFDIDALSTAYRTSGRPYADEAIVQYR
jgi:predicted phosphodiesterase